MAKKFPKTTVYEGKITKVTLEKIKDTGVSLPYSVANANRLNHGGKVGDGTFIFGNSEYLNRPGYVYVPAQFIMNLDVLVEWSFKGSLSSKMLSFSIYINDEAEAKKINNSTLYQEAYLKAAEKILIGMPMVVTSTKSHKKADAVWAIIGPKEETLEKEVKIS